MRVPVNTAMRPFVAGGDDALARARARHRLINLVHSALLILGMAAILGASAWTLWGPDGVIWGLVGAGLALMLSPAMPPRLVLALYRARPLRYFEAPGLHAALEALSRRAGLPASPALYLVPSPVLNAFALGNRNAAAIAVTDGMLRNLTAREVAAVLAHEVGHIRNNDLWIMNLADVMSRTATVLSYAGMVLLIASLPLIAAGVATVPWPPVLLLLAAPLLSSLLQLALSRTREFDADLEAVRLMGEADSLASALAKLERRQGRFWEGLLLPSPRDPGPSLLRTHPPTEERLRRLAELGARPRKPTVPLVFTLPRELFGPWTRERRMPW